MTTDHGDDDRPRHRPWRIARGATGSPGRPPGWPPYTSRPFSDASAAPQRAPSAADRHGELLGEDEELVAGRRPVEEAFAARREAVRLLVVPERRAALDQLVIHATTLRIPVVELEGGSLTALAGFDGHQGIALVAKPRPPADMEQILAAARRATKHRSCSCSTRSRIPRTSARCCAARKRWASMA